MGNLATSAVQAFKGSVYYGSPAVYALSKMRHPQATERHIQRCDKAVKNVVKATSLLVPSTLIIAEIKEKGGAQKRFNNGINAIRNIFNK